MNILVVVQTVGVHQFPRTEIVVSAWTKKSVMRGGLAYVVEPVEFVVVVQTVVPELHVLPAVRGQVMFWGGLPATEIVVPGEMFPQKQLKVVRIFTMASVFVLNQRSAGCLYERPPTGIIMAAATRYVG